MLFVDSACKYAKGSKIITKIIIGIINLGRTNFSFLCLIKNIIKNGISKTIPSYLINVKSANIENEA